MASNDGDGHHNQNATKHGLYQRFVPREDLALVLELGAHGDLELEIGLVRLAMLRLYERRDQLTSPDELVLALARGSDALSRMLRVRRELTAGGGGLAGALEEALERLGIAGDET